MFSTLRKGASIYILDKTSDPTVKVGYIENVTMPRPMYPTYNPAVSLGTNMSTVVDLTVRVGENKEAMISEVDSMLQDSKNVLDSIDKHKANVIACENILKELNPVYAKESERDSAISSLT